MLYIFIKSFHYYIYYKIVILYILHYGFWFFYKNYIYNLLHMLHKLLSFDI